MLFFSLMLANGLLADRFDVGGTELVVPAPQGYVRVTDEMPQAIEMIERLTVEEHRVLAAYIPEHRLQQALNGQLPDFDRFLTLSIHPKIADFVLTKADFAQVCAELISRQERKLAMQSEGASAQPAPSGEGMPRAPAAGSPPEANTHTIVPLAFHRKTADAYATSLLLGLDLDEKMQSSSTVTLVNVAGKGIFLGASSTREDLEWTRAASVAWERAILSQNLQPPEAKLFGMSVSRVVLIGNGVLALIVIFVGSRVRKRRGKLL